MGKVIHIENLNVSYGQTVALRDINLEVNSGEYLAIMGPNGGGKSTLLKAILGLVPINSGKVLVCSSAKDKCSIQISYVPQFSDIDKNFPISAIEVVMTSYLKNGIHPLFRYNKKQKENALKQMEYVGIADLAKRQISQLSGGEFQRLLIARALAVDSKILILDEPTASVDPHSREVIYGILDDLNKKSKKTILMVTHDLSAISSKVSKLACLNETLVYHGEPEISQEVVNKMFGCPVDLIAHGVPHRVLKEHREGQ